MTLTLKLKADQSASSEIIVIETNIAQPPQPQPQPQPHHLIPITCELIRELKNSGRNEAANKLLKAYYEDLKKMKKQILKEIYHQDYAIVRHVNKNLNRCLHTRYNDFCFEPRRKGSKYCERHYQRMLEYRFLEGLKRLLTNEKD